ncbi:YndJ family transporter [Dictyobacter arantiisoli]|uniref:YndJ-like protein n=1 Tax=Dictyobacter arantiisoli TaxID=2014874 RepID=A0A5A5TCH7_9CHLR|nr:YndJ family transporter [Dictyobacter arantiisoli]GCF08654.1 hypothetical protein KDI_22180 [Dictyobacter arantiisoli]
MSLHKDHVVRWNGISLGLGGGVWGGSVCVRLLGWTQLNDLEIVLLLALFVITPLALPFVFFQNKGPLFSKWTALVVFLQPLAAFLGGASFFLPAGPLAATFAAGWGGFTGLLALLGLVQLCQMRRRHRLSLTELCLAGALLYLPAGGAWMVLACWGLQPLGFGVHTDLLTAVHFHVIPLAALVITGLTGQALHNRPATRRGVCWAAYRIAAIGVLIDPLLVAAGMTGAQITSLPDLDTVPADLLALSLILLTLLGLRFVVPTTVSRVAQVLLTLSYLTVFFTMLVAGTYVLGVTTGAWTITIAQMIAIHGLENALLFGCCGLIGWRLRTGQESQRSRRGEPCAY